MNRRKFLRALAVVPVAAVVATKLPSDTVTGTQVSHPRVKEVWSPKLKDSLREKHRHRLRPKQFLFVVPYYKDADAIFNAMGRPRNVKVIGLGSTICGYGANHIIMDDACRALADRGSFNYEGWVNNTIRTRLMPHGQETAVRFHTESFDWDTQAGVCAQFFTYGIKYQRQGMRFRKARRLITDEDQIAARANLFTWFMEKNA